VSNGTVMVNNEFKMLGSGHGIFGGIILAFVWKTKENFIL